MALSGNVSTTHLTADGLVRSSSAVATGASERARKDERKPHLRPRQRQLLAKRVISHASPAPACVCVSRGQTVSVPLADADRIACVWVAKGRLLFSQWRVCVSYLDFWEYPSFPYRLSSADDVLVIT